MFVLFDRKIKIQTGVKSQTVNICTKENILGKYEYRVRLHPPFYVEPDNLVEKRFGNIQEIVTYLQDQHNRTIEISPSDSFPPDKLHTANWLYSFLEKLEQKYYITKSEQISIDEVTEKLSTVQFN